LAFIHQNSKVSNLNFLLLQAVAPKAIKMLITVAVVVIAISTAAWMLWL
jgi:hypothetical protein